MCACGGRKEGRRGSKGWYGMLPKREGMHSGPFVLRVFNLSLAGGNLREDLRGRFQQNIHQFSRGAFSGL